MMFVTAIVACMAIYDYIDAGEGGSLESSRIGGIVDQPNMLAAFFNYYMFLPLAFMLMNTKKSKYWLFLIPVLLEFRGVMVTFSRGGYMAFALGLYAISFFRSKMLFVFLILVGFIVYFNPILLPAGVRYRMGQTFQIDKTSAQEVEYDEASLESSAKSRVEIWRASVDMIKDHPVFGVGYKLFPYMLEYYAPQWKGFDAHNTYIIITAEMGIPALLIFLWCILSILWQTLRLYRRTNDHYAKTIALGYLGGIFGLLLSNMFGSRLDSQEVASYFWILAALVMRFKILDERDAAHPNSHEEVIKLNSKPGKLKSHKLDACWSE